MMNICLKYLFLISVILLTFGCVNSSAEPESKQKHSIERCDEAKHGTLDVSLVDYDDSSNNAYLLDCAVSVTISGPSSISGESKANDQRRVQKEKKMEIANFLLSKEIDINYRNEYGDTLLMSVITSFMSSEWKESTVVTLIRKGVDVNEKNINGDTAMDLAKYKENANIVEILSVNGG